MTQRKIVLEAYAVALVLGAFVDISEEGDDVEFVVGKDDVSAGVELEEQVVLAVGELNVDDAVGADLGDRRDSSGTEVLSQASDKGRGSSGRGSSKGCKVASETRVDNQLFALLGFGELEEEDAGGEVVDVGEAEGDELG
mgnify:CR=1 FL=1